jgi:hypothetical protein
MKPTSPTTTTHIINLLHDGHSLHHIAEITGSSKSNISNIIHRIQDKEYSHPGERSHLISSPTCCHLTCKVRVGDINTVQGVKMLSNQLSTNCFISTTRRAQCYIKVQSEMKEKYRKTL